MDMVSFLSFLDFLYFLCYLLLHQCVLRLGGTRKPHHNGDLRRNRSGGETGLCVYIAMIYVGRMQ